MFSTVSTIKSNIIHSLSIIDNIKYDKNDINKSQDLTVLLQSSLEQLNLLTNQIEQALTKFKKQQKVVNDLNNLIDMD